MKLRIKLLLLLFCIFAFAGCEAPEETRELPAAATTAYGTLVWPETEITALLPRPASDRGTVESATDSELTILVADTTQEAFQSYVEACWSNGFSFHYRSGDDYYYASKVGGYHLSISLEEGGLMRIMLDGPPPEAETQAADETTPAEESTAETEDSGRTLPEQPDEAAAVQETQREACDYVVNTNTRKFHRPECSSVKDIKEKNRKDFHGSREELIEEGYEPCKRCNP